MYKKLRFAARFAVSLVAKYRLAIVIGLVVGALSFFSFPLLLTRLPVLRPTQKVGLVGRYTISDLPPNITSKISIGLTILSPSGQTSPGLADSWQATDSGKTYVFTINPDFRWHDGSPLKSPDIKYSFKDAAVSYPDDRHLVISLTDPFAPLPAIVSKPVLKSTGFPRRYLGVGAYKIAGFTRNGPLIESVSLTPAAPDSTLPNLRYIFYPTQSQARTALKLGVLSSIEDLPDPADLSQWPNLNLTPLVHTDRYVAVFFNTEDPFLTGSGGKNLRLALSYAIDKSRFPQDRRAYGPISTDSWVYNADVKHYEQDVNRAKTLLKTAGDKIPQPLNLSVVPAYLDVAEAVKSDWEALGLSVNLQVTPDLPDGFQTLIVAQSIPADPDQYNLWHSTQTATNITKLKNPRIDKLLEDGRKIIDPTERRQTYLDFQRFLLEEVPAVFLFHPQTYTITRK